MSSYVLGVTGRVNSSTLGRWADEETRKRALQAGASDNCSIIFIWSFAPTVESADGSNNSKMCFLTVLVWLLCYFVTLSIIKKNERKAIPFDDQCCGQSANK